MTEKTNKMLVLIIVALSLLFVYKAMFTFSYTFDPNYRNVSVDTRVNITNAPPRIVTVTIEEDVGDVSNITLLAGRTRIVYCNATIIDWNGWDDINTTNATMWDNNVASQSDALNASSVYRNTSCTNGASDGQYVSYWVCAFDVWYYANNGTDWRCNVTTQDDARYNHSNYNTTEFSPLYAINISKQTIDYGNVAVEDYSTNQTADVINFGNIDINVSVWGYAKFPGDNLAFNCSISSNISIGNERFSINASEVWADKTNLSAIPKPVGLTVARQLNSTQSINTTYWQIYVPSVGAEVPAGLCTGTVVFQAESSN